MSRKKIALAAAALVVVAGTAAVVAQGHRGGGWHGGAMFGEHQEGHGMRGRFGRSLTKDEFDTRARERFARFDKNADGVIELSEIDAAMANRESRRGHRHGGDGMRGKAGMGDGAMGSHMLRRFDANRDGKVTADETRAEFERRFAEADLTRDGKIDDADLPPMMRGRNVIAEGVASKRHRRGGMRGMKWLSEADANKDGVVTVDEVAALSASHHARFDHNKDGSIDQADMDALRKDMRDYRARRIAHMMGADKDGRVTREQFQAKAAERFTRMDYDNDGTISRGERGGGWHGKHGGGHHGKGPHHGGKHGMGGGQMNPDGDRGPGQGGEPPAKN